VLEFLSSARMTDDLRSLLLTLDPTARDDLRRVPIHDQADRDAISSHLLRCRDRNGQDWADIIDMLTMYPNARRRVVQVLGEFRRGLAFPPDRSIGLWEGSTGRDQT
jgi:hypothetical protein